MLPNRGRGVNPKIAVTHPKIQSAQFSFLWFSISQSWLSRSLFWRLFLFFSHYIAAITLQPLGTTHNNCVLVFAPLIVFLHFSVEARVAFIQGINGLFCSCLGFWLIFSLTVRNKAFWRIVARVFQCEGQKLLSNCLIFLKSDVYWYYNSSESVAWERKCIAHYGITVYKDSATIEYIIHHSV